MLQKEGLKVAHKQGEYELLVRVPIGEGVRGKDIAFEVHPTRLRLAAHDEVLLEGDFSGHKVELAGVGCFVASATCNWHCCECRTASDAGSPSCRIGQHATYLQSSWRSSLLCRLLLVNRGGGGPAFRGDYHREGRR